MEPGRSPFVEISVWLVAEREYRIIRLLINVNHVAYLRSA